MQSPVSGSLDAPGSGADSPLRDAIPRLGRASVLVVGDVMLDRTVFGTVTRITREAPAPVLSVESELAVPGGAGNVVRGLGALGAAAAFVSVVGDDQAGSDLTGLIGGQPGVEPWLLVQGGRATTLKTRYIGRGSGNGAGETAPAVRMGPAQMLLRADHEDSSPIDVKLAERLVRIARDAMAATSVTVLSDYAKGVLAGDVAARLIVASDQAGRRVIVDPRGPDFARFAGAEVILPGRRDLGRATDLPVGSEAEIAAAASVLRDRHGFGAVLVTGSSGITVIDADGQDHAPVIARDVVDVTGVGDTAIAVLAAALAVGLPLSVGVRLVALAVEVALARPGTAAVRQADLAAALTARTTPSRRIVPGPVAAERVEGWRRQGLRVVLAGEQAGEGAAETEARLTRLRAGCDHLVVTLATPAAAEAMAALLCVDLVVLPATG